MVRNVRSYASTLPYSRTLREGTHFYLSLYMKKIKFQNKYSSEWYYGLPSKNPMRTGFYFPVEKGGRDANHSPPSSTWG